MMRCLVLSIVLLLFHLELTTPYHTTLDWTDDLFGFSENKTTVENMNPRRVGKCRPKRSDSSAAGDSKEATTKFACNPDFMFIGASKCGTSSIAEHLQRHPMVQNIQDNGRDNSNEAHLFDHGDKDSGKKSALQYIRETQPAILDLENRHLVMEYTPNYFAIDEAPLRIKEAFPDTYKKLKFIILIREPVGRTISSFAAKHSKGFDPKTFKDHKLFDACVTKGIKMGNCIEACYNSGAFNKSETDMSCNIASCRKKHDDASGRCGGNVFRAHVVKSMYAYQLLNWFMVFDRSQFYILTIEQYSQNPIWIFEKIVNHLGLPLYDKTGKFGFKSRSALIKILRMRSNVTPRVAEIDNQVTPELKSKLREFFKPHNRLLKKLLGWDPGYPV